jgi:hypothetical protein
MKLKLFQKQDLARAALHDGLILSWDTGLGKTWAMFLWPLLKCGFVTVVDAALGRVLKLKAPVLIVAPGDLHQQITDEAWKLSHPCRAAGFTSNVPSARASDEFARQPPY